jgi:glycosyltransferase involved in cell wall biosynthesis
MQRVADISRRTAGPRVAVVIPCHNDGRLVMEAAASVAAQDEICELVVVDDGSRDAETLACLEELSAAGTQVIHQPNQGPSAARMAGVSATRAPYVLPLDADDLLAPGAPKAMADALDADPALQLAWGDIEIFGARSALVPMARQLDPWRITYLNELPISTMVRRLAIQSAGGWEVTGGYEDWELWMRLAERGWRGAHVGRVTLRFRAQLAPRRHLSSRRRHEENRTLFRERRARLFRARRANWLRSPSPWPIKLTFPLVECLPLKEMNRQRLFIALRHLLEPSASADVPSTRVVISRAWRSAHRP